MQSNMDRSQGGNTFEMSTKKGKIPGEPDMGRFWLMDWLVDQGILRTMPKDRILVLHSYSRHADAKGISYPSVATVADEVGCSERSVQRHIRALCGKPYLLMTPVGATTGGDPSSIKSTTRYRMFAHTYMAFKQANRGDKTEDLSPVPPVDNQWKTPQIDQLTGDKQGGSGVTKQAGRGDTLLSPEGTVKELEGITGNLFKKVNGKGGALKETATTPGEIRQAFFEHCDKHPELAIA